jgi:hypothetical protein
VADPRGLQSASTQPTPTRPTIDLARPDGPHQARVSNPHSARSVGLRPIRGCRIRGRPTHVRRRHVRLDLRLSGYRLPDCEHHRRLARARPSQPPSVYLIQNRLNASRPSSTRQLPPMISTYQIQAPHR